MTLVLILFVLSFPAYAVMSSQSSSPMPQSLRLEKVQSYLSDDTGDESFIQRAYSVGSKTDVLPPLKDSYMDMSGSQKSMDRLNNPKTCSAPHLNNKLVPGMAGSQEEIARTPPGKANEGDDLLMEMNFRLGKCNKVDTQGYLDMRPRSASGGSRDLPCASRSSSVAQYERTRTGSFGTKESRLNFFRRFKGNSFAEGKTDAHRPRTATIAQESLRPRTSSLGSSDMRPRSSSQVAGGMGKLRDFLKLSKESSSNHGSQDSLKRQSKGKRTSQESLNEYLDMNPKTAPSPSQALEATFFAAEKPLAKPPVTKVNSAPQRERKLSSEDSAYFNIETPSDVRSVQTHKRNTSGGRIPNDGSSAKLNSVNAGAKRSSAATYSADTDQYISIEYGEKKDKKDTADKKSVKSERPSSLVDTDDSYVLYNPADDTGSSVGVHPGSHVGLQKVSSPIAETGSGFHAGGAGPHAGHTSSVKDRSKKQKMAAIAEIRTSTAQEEETAGNSRHTARPRLDSAKSRTKPLPYPYPVQADEPKSSISSNTLTGTAPSVQPPQTSTSSQSTPAAKPPIAQFSDYMEMSSSDAAAKSPRTTTPSSKEVKSARTSTSGDYMEMPGKGKCEVKGTTQKVPAVSHKAKTALPSSSSPPVTSNQPVSKGISHVTQHTGNTAGSVSTARSSKLGINKAAIHAGSSASSGEGDYMMLSGSTSATGSSQAKRSPPPATSIASRLSTSGGAKLPGSSPSPALATSAMLNPAIPESPVSPQPNKSTDIPLRIQTNPCSPGPSQASPKTPVFFTPSDSPTSETGAAKPSVNPTSGRTVAPQRKRFSIGSSPEPPSTGSSGLVRIAPLGTRGGSSPSLSSLAPGQVSPRVGFPLKGSNSQTLLGELQASNTSLNDDEQQLNYATLDLHTAKPETPKSTEDNTRTLAAPASGCDLTLEYAEIDFKRSQELRQVTGSVPKSTPKPFDI